MIRTIVKSAEWSFAPVDKAITTARGSSDVWPFSTQSMMKNRLLMNNAATAISMYALTVSIRYRGVRPAQQAQINAVFRMPPNARMVQ